MFDYLAFIYAGISEPSGDAREDGNILATQCLKKLDAIANKDRFPPKLLILLASPAYLPKQKAEQLLKGVNSTFGESYQGVQLVGSSVGGVLFDRKVHRAGALLVCLASRLIEASVACGTNARQNPKSAINRLLKDLGLDPSKHIDPNPLANRLILTFLPGCSQAARNGNFYPAPELHRRLYDGVQTRITLIGGVSSANDPSRKVDGLQFAQQSVLRDSVVAASIVSGVPIGVSLNDGLSNPGKILRVTKLGTDKRTIIEFNGYGSEEQLGPEAKDVMLAKFSADDERIIDIPLPGSDGSVQLLRQVELNDHFQVLQPASQILETIQEGVEQAKRRVYVQRPVASLMFPCKAYCLRHERGILNVETALAQIEKGQGGPCAGGFFDGELGVDETGRSRLTNGGVSYVIFGDEMRERTPLYKGISALANYEPILLAGSELAATSIHEAIDTALSIVDETGFPGAMISLVHSNLDRTANEEEEFIIARKAVGSRFEKIVSQTKRARKGDDILAIIARDQPDQKGGRFIRDSRQNPFCDQEAVSLSGIISQYILPLKRLDNTVFGMLQVDLGDLQHLSEADFRKTEKARTLDCFAEVIGASINRIASTIENNIMLSLDKALKNSLSAPTVRAGLNKFFSATKEAFGVDMGFLRLVRHHDSPVGSTRKTLVLEAGFGVCYEAEMKDRSEIDTNDFSPICCALRAGAPQIVNDVSTDPAWQAMLESVNPTLSTLLRLTKSYAAASFLGEDGQPLGAISFGSTRRWFFLKFHQNVLEVLAERLTFLVQHLHAKTERNFLVDVSPKLGEQDLNDADKILENVTRDFCVALNADVASLYLWDQDREKYILRCQSNWREGNWVHAANYGKEAGWIGVRAINREPLHLIDLRKYYLDNGYDYPNGRYAEYMFGKPLSDTFVVEAIGLPLRIGLEKADKFGVLTLYRRIEQGQPTGFRTTNIQLLQEAAYKISGLINAVLRHRDDMWEKEEGRRRQEVYQAVNSGGKASLFERRVCWQLLKSFRAVRAEFYKVNRVSSNSRPFWITGASRSLQNNTIGTLKQAAPDRLVQKTLISKKVEVERNELSSNSAADPMSLKTVGLVTRACIPLMAAKELRGILDVRWSINPNQAFSPEVQHSDEQLTILGQILGSAYLRYHMLYHGKQRSLALQAVAAYSAQRGHLLRNMINKIYDRVNLIKRGRADLSFLDNPIKIATDIVNETMNLGLRVLHQSYHRCGLSALIAETLLEKNSLLANRIDELKIKFSNTVADDCIVRVDPLHTKEALLNLINNAADAIESNRELGKAVFAERDIEYSSFVPDDRMVRIDPSRRLLDNISDNPTSALAIKKEIEAMLIVPEINIRVTATDDKKVKLVISDNGIGMTKSEILDALSGFDRASDQTGVGVLISRLLLTAQGGTLRFSSEKYVSTDAILTLPSGEMDNTYETETFDGFDDSYSRA
jgi:signal transduction histidine kinase